MRDTPCNVLALSQLALVLHLQPELDRNFAVPAAAAECARTHAVTMQRGGGGYDVASLTSPLAAALQT